MDIFGDKNYGRMSVDCYGRSPTETYTYAIMSIRLVELNVMFRRLRAKVACTGIGKAKVKKFPNLVTLQRPIGGTSA